MAKETQVMTDEFEPQPEPEHIPPPRNENFKWYILHAYSGFERKVKESLESRIQAFGLESKFGRIMIPTEPVTETVNGKKTHDRASLPARLCADRNGAG
jgi:transcriptional antiterminator NusG